MKNDRDGGTGNRTTKGLTSKGSAESEKITMPASL